jgi:hypothetical protein
LLVVDRTRSHHLLVVEAGALLPSMCAEHGACGSAPVRLWRVVVLTTSTPSPPRQALFVPALVIIVWVHPMASFACQIALRGPGDATIKRAAVSAVTELMLQPSAKLVWALFGERWCVQQ